MMRNCSCDIGFVEIGGLPEGEAAEVWYKYEETRWASSPSNPNLFSQNQLTRRGPKGPAVRTMDYFLGCCFVLFCCWKMK